MGENSLIAWCHHTHNEWVGCMKVSRGCDHCYAETLMDTRYHRVSWGQRKTDETKPSVGTRSRTSEANRRKPLTWNRKAAAAGERHRVFSASLSDWLDNQVPRSWRDDLGSTIVATPNLDWLLLTKRIENYAKLSPWPPGHVPPNVWLGVTAEDQEAYDERWPILARIPARVRFVSAEPLLDDLLLDGHKEKPEWLICGGESGRGFRPMPWTAPYRLREQCEMFGVAFYMKQMAGLKPIPPDLMVRQFPPGATP